MVKRANNLDILSKKKRVALLSVLSNSLLVIFKAVVGLFIGSVSVISEAIHSCMDLLAAIIAFIAVRISYKSPDDEHTFGHGKVENLSALAEAMLIFLAAAWIIYEAVLKIFSPHPLEQVSWGVLVMLISIVANFLVSRMLFKVGTETDSAALIADGWHLRTDVYTSLGVMTALGIIVIGGYFLPGINLVWIDPVAAIIVAILILRAAFRLTIHAIKDLLDASTPPVEKEWIRNYLVNLYPTIHSFHKIRTRKSGPVRFIDFHLVVQSAMTVSASHQIGDKIVRDFKGHFPGADVILHIEPCDGSCSYACISGCLLTEAEREKYRKSYAKVNR